jgi:hypothetical protein
MDFAVGYFGAGMATTIYLILALLVITINRWGRTDD